jgi:ATP-dependent DNA helicase RecG
MKLTDTLQMVKGVGPKNADILRSAGLMTVENLIDYWPRKYDDFSQLSPISQIQPGLVSIKGTFNAVKSRHSRRGLHLTEAVLSDSTGSIKIVWFNQPYRGASLKKNVEYLVSGEFALKAGQLSITNPRIEQAEEENRGRILPIYRESKKLQSSLIRRIMPKLEPMFEQVPETLPEWLLDSHDLLSRAEALKQLHLPESAEALQASKRRLAFEELFQMQLAGAFTRQELLKEQSPQIEFNERVAQDFVAHLSYTLTSDQKKTVWQIYKDMQTSNGMNRLVEGDVGSGKTVVAAMSSIMAMHAGFQVLYMAPTEILARQHAETMSQLLAHTPYASQIGLLVGGLKSAQKTALHERIASGDCRLAIGTNALIQDKVATENVGLVIIDEQHRFGVEQRTKLRSKAGLYPHVLCMTATPIPRTLALTLYGELSVTQLRSMPSGRLPIITELIRPSEREAMYARIEEQLEQGRQVFFVCPLIEENEDLGLRSAESVHDELAKKHFKKWRTGLLHGRMKPDEKDEVMGRYARGEIDVLVATTVIEVGVNVPNATIMVVEGAERFGLAQIHQLRGRVGRAEYQGYCFLVPTDDTVYSKRLHVLTYVQDGFRLSEIDLELRGPGAIYGMRQSGALDLRIASLHDERLIADAKRAAEEFVNRGEDLLKYNVLHERVNHFSSISKLN